MHLHKYEKIWLSFGILILILFLSIVGITAFTQSMHPPSSQHTIDHEKVDTIAPFDNPGLKKIGENEYELVVVLSAFDFNVGTLDKVVEIPKGAKVHYIMTTKDVIHGFEVAGTNVNMMVVPGHISHYTTTHDKPGKFTIVCNEYCGAGHHYMSATIEVVENE